VILLIEKMFIPQKEVSLHDHSIGTLIFCLIFCWLFRVHGKILDLPMHLNSLPTRLKSVVTVFGFLDKIKASHYYW